jgi:sporulation protein YlmC with PRC-barrel domain
MTGTRALVLLLIVAVPILGACARGVGADELPASGADVQIVELVGYQVYNPTGKWLGEVAGVLLELKTGEVGYVVLSYREPRVYGRAVMVTNPQRFIPIPWAWFTPGPEKHTLSLDAGEMTLIPAPYLGKAPVSLNAELAQAIDDYWQSVNGKGNQADCEAGPE